MSDVVEYILYYAPVAIVAGLVLGVAGSKEFKRGLLRGALNSVLLVGGMAALIFLVQLATDPTIL
ncbi:MAG: hypothetical protein K8I27_01595 [Planctomycetes bacterium]|nr:hypothetical protein [Planctomycetota bacterium]